MLDFNSPAPYLVALLISLLAYFLRDAHVNIKLGLKEKATQKELDDTTLQWRDDLRALENRHAREMSRLEHQYEQKFAAVVNQFQDRMNSVERNLQDKMDLILELLKQRTP